MRVADEDQNDPDDIGSNASTETSIGEFIGRRQTLMGLAGLGGLSTFKRSTALAQNGTPSTFTFKEVAHSNDPEQHIPEGYEAQILIRWGDPVLSGAPAFDPNKLTAAGQARQFGYNNDFLGLHPLPQGSRGSDRFLMVVNHEYTNTGLMFAGLGTGKAARLGASREQCEIEMAAHGGAVIEIVRENGKWSVVPDSKYARRITADTPMRIAGPASGHDLLKTSADPTGTRVNGMFNNCAGGETPWGTWLTCEENFNNYFGGLATKTANAEPFKRYGVGAGRPSYAWGQHFARFDVEKEPNEPNRFGWIVEIDPYDPEGTPVKRTALGRFKHEGCHHTLAKDGRVVFYMGDDERFDYVYKFVTARPWNLTDRAANRDLLDDGTLFVARFAADGKVTWLPLVHGEGPLTAANGFANQAEVLIKCRLAADLLQPTPMDRPEDIEANPVTGNVFVVLTNNGSRKPEQVDAANPRAANNHGHIIEIVPKDGDHAALEAGWSIFLVAGDPARHQGTAYHPGVSQHGWLTSPDNITFDSKGRLWIATDAAKAAGIADGVFTTDVSGPGKALTRAFYSAPMGSEVCGPTLTPDDTTLFIAIQHPGETKGSTFETPSTRWPDFKDGMPPRPSIVAITKKGGGALGS